jgi:ABC-type nitrate/sulfonate/bicarbonate transport system permease component
MRRSFRRLFPLFLAVALASGACEESVDSGALNPTPTPDPESVTETFSGSLNRNGAVTHTFATNGAGTVVAALLTIAPDSTVAVSLGLGTWTGNACQVVLANDNAIQGVSITGSGSAAGTFCVRISDAGNITDTITYEVRVTHP